MTASKPEVVARILTWAGPRHAPVPFDGLCARTFNEFPLENEHHGYWKESEPLIRLTDHETAISELAEQKSDWAERAKALGDKCDRLQAENQRLREALTRHVCTGVTDAERTAELDCYLSDGIAADKARIAELEAALSRAAAWIEKLPVPTKGACAQLARIDAALAHQDSEWRENEQQSPELAAAIAAREEAISLVHNLKQQAQIHAQEARTANATIAEIYRIVSGGKGEPGNWNGAEPVRKRIAELEGLAREIVKQYPNPNLTHEQFRVHACKHAEAVVGQRDTDCTLECGAYGSYCLCAAYRAAQLSKEEK